MEPVDFSKRPSRCAMAPAQLELEVVLAQRDHTIYFTKTHRQDLLTVIEASQLSCGQSVTEPQS